MVKALSCRHHSEDVLVRISSSSRDTDTFFHSAQSPLEENTFLLNQPCTRESVLFTHTGNLRADDLSLVYPPLHFPSTTLSEAAAVSGKAMVVIKMPRGTDKNSLVNKSVEVLASMMAQAYRRAVVSKRGDGKG